MNVPYGTHTIVDCVFFMLLAEVLPAFRQLELLVN